MHVNFGVVPPLSDGVRRSKRDRYAAYSSRALARPRCVPRVPAGTVPVQGLTRRARASASGRMRGGGHMDDEIARLLGSSTTTSRTSPASRAPRLRPFAPTTQHLEAYARWAARTGRDGLAPSTRDVRAYLSELRAAGYAARTVAAHLSSIRSFFRWLSDEGLAGADAVTAIAQPQARPPASPRPGARSARAPHGCARPRERRAASATPRCSSCS